MATPPIDPKLDGSSALEHRYEHRYQRRVRARVHDHIVKRGGKIFIESIKNSFNQQRPGTRIEKRLLEEDLIRDIGSRAMNVHSSIPLTPDNRSGPEVPAMLLSFAITIPDASSRSTSRPPQSSLWHGAARRQATKFTAFGPHLFRRPSAVMNKDYAAMKGVASESPAWPRSRSTRRPSTSCRTSNCARSRRLNGGTIPMSSSRPFRT